MREMNDYLQLIDNKINSLRESHLNLVPFLFTLSDELAIESYYSTPFDFFQ